MSVPSATDIDVVIGARIRQARTYRNATLEEVAARVQISSGVLGAVERGKRRVPAELIARCARVLRLPVNYFLDDIL